jgi:hypothetical protein
MTLIDKLKTKSGAIAVINSPKEILAQFKSFKPVADITAGKKQRFDFVLLFATSSKELEAAWKRIIPALKNEAIFWLAYPKKSSGITTDLGIMSGGPRIFTGSPWQPVASASIDDTWTGTRFRFAPGLEKERSDRAEEAIRDSDGTVVVDRVNRVVQPPKDLAVVLSKHPEAKAFFEGLSFTNRKEYVVWIVGAQKSETRSNRVTAALEKLVSGKKNPSEK